jgi:aldehyde dehydrogenase (NAD+)
MKDKTKFYINGQWVKSVDGQLFPVINPATEEAYATISLGGAQDTLIAVGAAKAAFDDWSNTTPNERLDYLRSLLSVYETRSYDLAKEISEEMGAPIDMSFEDQVGAGKGHLKSFIEAIGQVKFQQSMLGFDGQDVRLEAAGVAALITPWNWPMNQIVLKVGAALSAGCTMVLKPSEISPISAMIFAEIIDKAGIPAGVFNLINGDGPGVGSWLTSHKDVDVVSFTGSTRAGILIGKAAAESIKRVSLELGGKSPNLIFADTNVEEAVARGARAVFNNSGQSCNAPTRMLVESIIYEKAVKIAADTANQTKVDLPSKRGAHIGPVVSEAQFLKIQELIQSGIDEGATLIAGGVGRPDGFDRGWFVKPTVFADVKPEMRIVREEIFGPVFTIMPFDNEAEAIFHANDTLYGLSSYVQTDDRDRARRLSSQLRAGMVRINGTTGVDSSPFGGYKQSGIGREGGVWGIEEFLEVKHISGLE